MEFIELDTTSKGTVKVLFGIGLAKSMGSISIHTPIGQVDFYIIPSDTLFLLCLKDMDRLQVTFDNLNNVLVTPTSRIKVIRRFGYAFMLWGKLFTTLLVQSFTLNPCYLTEPELRRLHKRFGHPAVGRLRDILERSGYNTDSSTLKRIIEFGSHC